MQLGAALVHEPDLLVLDEAFARLDPIVCDVLTDVLREQATRGGLLGIAIGLLFGFLMTAALADLGLSFSVPFAQLAGFLVLAVVVGILAAVVPARRGARVDVLRALHSD